MDHSHLEKLDHAETFSEIIAQGFPHDKLELLAKAHQERVHERLAPRAARFLRALGDVEAVTREDQATLSPTKQAAFRDAVLKLVEEDKYLELTQHHMDMSHNMHGSMGEVGLYRFLGWHRRYLLEFERELQRADAILRPGITDKLGIPYWRWQDPFPAWLVDFLPAKDPVTGLQPPGRRNASPPPKADAVDIDIIINQFSIQDTRFADENEYTKFTYGIEGYGLRPNGSSLPAHNHGHGWIGGIMDNVRTSPTDPMFWLHHAEIDRLWQIWRQNNPLAVPRLAGNDRIMDPWAESYDDLLDIATLGYTYDSMSL